MGANGTKRVVGEGESLTWRIMRVYVRDGHQTMLPRYKTFAVSRRYSKWNIRNGKVFEIRVPSLDIDEVNVMKKKLSISHSEDRRNSVVIK